jgi:hypothetical protein
MTTDPTTVAAVRSALLPAIERDAARTTRRLAPGRTVAALAVFAAMATTGVAAATGVIFAPPKPDSAVPAVAPWTFYSSNPYGEPGSGAVLMRPKPEALARRNREAEALLARDGVTARCGTDAAHPLACFLPSGDPVPPADLGAVLNLQDGPGDYDVQPLTAAEAHAFLCTHPTQRPGADGGERPAPTAGYEDCGGR